MKCLMVKPEWAALIAAGEKLEEYRTWQTAYRGDIFIGCSSTHKSRAFLCAVVKIDDVVLSDDNVTYIWKLSNARAIEPIPITGRLRLFETQIEQYRVLATDEEVEEAYNAAQWINKKG